MGIGFAVEAPVGPRLDLDGGYSLGDLKGICKKLWFYMDHPHALGGEGPAPQSSINWTPFYTQYSLLWFSGPLTLNW